MEDHEDNSGNSNKKDCRKDEYEIERAVDAAENQPPDYDSLALEWGGIEGYRDVSE